MPQTAHQQLVMRPNALPVMVWVGLYGRCNINDTLQYCNHGIYRTVFLSGISWGTD